MNSNNNNNNRKRKQPALPRRVQRLSNIAERLEAIAVSGPRKPAARRLGMRGVRRSRSTRTPGTFGLSIGGRSNLVSTRDGGLKLTFSEKWPNFFNDAGAVVSKAFYPGGSGLQWLDLHALLYETVVLNQCRVRYVTGSGTTNNGRLDMGIDYDSQDPVTTVGGVQLLMPRVDCPVWENAALIVEPSRAMKGRYHYTDHGKNHPDLGSMFSVVATSPMANCGDIWVDYVVTLFGPNPPATVVPPGDLFTFNGTFEFAWDLATTTWVNTLDNETNWWAGTDSLDTVMYPGVVVGPSPSQAFQVQIPLGLTVDDSSAPGIGTYLVNCTAVLGNGNTGDEHFSVNATGIPISPWLLSYSSTDCVVALDASYNTEDSTAAGAVQSSVWHVSSVGSNAASINISGAPNAMTAANGDQLTISVAAIKIS